MRERGKRADSGAPGSTPGLSVLLSIGVFALAAACTTATRSQQTRGPSQDHFSAKKKLQYGVILRQGKREVELARRLDRAAFQKRHRHLVEEEYVLEDFEVVEESEERRFSGVRFYGVWHKSSAPPTQHLDLALSQEDFDAARTEAENHGLYPVDIETYLDDGERRFAVLWTDAAAKHRPKLQMDIAVEKVRNIAQNQAIVDLESWLDADGDSRYLAVYREPTASTQSILDRDFYAYYVIVDHLMKNGYRPLELEIEGDANDRARYFATWEKADDAYWLFTGVGELGRAAQDCRMVSLGIKLPGALSPEDVACCRSLGREGANELDESVSSTPSPSATQSSTAGAELEQTAADRATMAVNEPPACGTIHEKHLPSEPVHIVDFTVTRHALIDPTVRIVLEHPGVIHDTGGSGP